MRVRNRKRLYAELLLNLKRLQLGRSSFDVGINHGTDTRVHRVDQVENEFRLTFDLTLSRAEGGCSTDRGVEQVFDRVQSSRCISFGLHAEVSDGTKATSSFSSVLRAKVCDAKHSVATGRGERKRCSFCGRIVSFGDGNFQIVDRFVVEQLFEARDDIVDGLVSTCRVGDTVDGERVTFRDRATVKGDGDRVVFVNLRLLEGRHDVGFIPGNSACGRQLDGRIVDKRVDSIVACCSCEVKACPVDFITQCLSNRVDRIASFGRVRDFRSVEIEREDITGGDFSTFDGQR